MTPAWGIFAGVVTLVLLLVFLAIWAWAWLPHHKRAFDELAKLPLDDLEDGR
jgi:cytochrome c oxidase cbb3-type subunit 4